MSPRRRVQDAAVEIDESSSLQRGPRRVDDQATAHASPARELQASLAEHLHNGLADEPQHWPGAVRLAIICGGSALTWAGVILLCRAALKL